MSPVPWKSRPALHALASVAAGLFGVATAFAVLGLPQGAGACSMDCSDQRFYLDLASVEVLEGSVDATLVQEEWAAVGSVQAQAGGGLIAKDGCNDPLMQLAREGN